MDILIKKLSGDYEGYQPQEIHELHGEPLSWNGMAILERIPKKISHFFNRDLIEGIRRHNLKDDYSRNHYFIKDIDGKFHEVTY